MLLSNKTVQEFGYELGSLTKHSKKIVCLKCDYCGDEYNNVYARVLISHKVISKDACKKCRMIKIGDINFIKLGVRNVFELKSTKDKLTKTNLDRYGVERPSQSQAIKDKVKDTMMERYGTNSVSLIDGMQDRIKKTCLSKYGVENPSSVEEFKEKRRNTCKEKFGKETYLGSKDCIDKTIQKFGTDNVFKLKEFQDKAIAGRLASGNIKTHEDLADK